MSRLAVIVYSVDNPVWTEVVLRHLEKTTSAETEIVIVDCGSEPPFPADWGQKHVRYDENPGGNAIFHRWITDRWWDEPPEFLAFLHCDVVIYEENWDQRVIAAFDNDPKLNLIGFVGSNRIDELGGRGGGTVLNFKGAFVEGIGQASPTSHHGVAYDGLAPAAVVDHLAMIFRRSELEQLTPQEGTYAPEHFYDRILSCEILERGGHIAVLGISCDHFSGGTGPGARKAEQLRERWLLSEGMPFHPLTNHGDVYHESERRFKKRYMQNRFAPLTVNSDYSISRP